MSDTRQRFTSLSDAIEASGLKKYVVAKQLGVANYQLSALLYPGRYSIRVDDELAKRLAKFMNQSVAFVRDLYPKKAA